MASTRVERPTGMRSVAELASQVLRQGRCLRIKARGGSMTPFLRDGDIAHVTPVVAADVRVGDVICYETAPGNLFLHRVVTRQGVRLGAKGDALTGAEMISLGQILGTVRAIERHDRVRRLDTRTARWWNRVVVFVSPALARLLPVAIGGRRLARAVLRG